MKASEPLSSRSTTPGLIARLRETAGVTLFEVLIVVAIVAILASLSVEIYAGALERARTARAIADIRNLQSVIDARGYDEELPESLDEIGWGGRLDPWKRPYVYVNFALEAPPNGNLNQIARKDRFLVPLNTTYDLYSLGPDGRTKLALTAQASHDDIVRAADGAFVGIAADF
jgi:general secretion pathway protein G